MMETYRKSMEHLIFWTIWGNLLKRGIFSETYRKFVNFMDDVQEWTLYQYGFLFGPFMWIRFWNGLSIVMASPGKWMRLTYQDGMAYHVDKPRWLLFQPGCAHTWYILIFQWVGMITQQDISWCSKPAWDRDQNPKWSAHIGNGLMMGDPRRLQHLKNIFLFLLMFQQPPRMCQFTWSTGSSCWPSAGQVAWPLEHPAFWYLEVTRKRPLV